MHQARASRPRLTSFSTWALLPWLALCACSGVASSVDAMSPLDDGGASVDSGHPQADGGEPQDDGGNSPADAGSRPDAGPAHDAGVYVDGGADACPAGAVFCESFENGIDSARWRVHGDAQTFSVDSTVSRDGRSSLHMSYGAPYGHTGTQSMEIATSIPAPDDRIYLRAYLRFGDLSLPGDHPAFVDVMDSAGHELGFGSEINDFAMLAWVPGSLDSYRPWIEGGGNQWHPGNQDGDTTPGDENGLLAQTWFCLEVMYFGDHQGPQDTNHNAEEVKVWINGNEIPQLGATDAIWAADLGHAPPEHWSPIYDNASWRFGVESFGPTHVALDIWFDAIVLSHTRVGCMP